MASSVAAQVKENLRKSLPESLLKDRNDQECIAPFMTKEIVLGRKLGSGEFSHVYRVKSFRLDNSLESSFSTEECAMRHHMRRTENYHNTKKCSYALKHLRPDLINKYESNEYALLARDLVQEAELLAVLQHPNIITLRGTSLFGHNGFAQGPKGYFMILDRLEETLFDRIAMWKRSTRPRRRSWLLCKQTKEKGSINEGCTLTEQLLSQQLEVALQVAAAIVYLHDKNIIYRDLKPANVGFDVQGNVKLFDFGLAKVMPLNGDPYHDKFVMSGAGSPRYMAPEVLSSKTTYNLKADVYTFGVVLWEVLSLEKPYAFIRSMDTLIEHVNSGVRPDINLKWPFSIQEVLKMSFDPSPSKRPSMTFIFEAIGSTLNHIRDGGSSHQQHSRLSRGQSMGSTKDWRDNLYETDPSKKSEKLHSAFVKLSGKFYMLGREIK
ncbi:hypothetical protein ACHAW6_007301 [Cyclotella cf. meneghiniana]